VTPESFPSRRDRILAEFERVCSSSHSFPAVCYSRLARDLDALADEAPIGAQKYRDRAEECRGRAVRAELREREAA
jgi:hypothetical protein